MALSDMQDQLLSTRMGKYLESAYQNLLLIGNACLTNAQTALKMHIFQVGLANAYMQFYKRVLGFYLTVAAVMQ